jgi:Holliday junction resolvase RusA-like endonuclease
MTNPQIFVITPVPAPRQVASDKWNPRPNVLRYRAFKDQVKAAGMTLPSIPCKITFYIELPSSWSAKKKAAMNGKPHEVMPDTDNLLKAALDAVYQTLEGKDDAHVWSIWAEKRWSETGHICIEPLCKGL